jgi:CRISPR/Cas system CSM-associated protein Csm4 (group 5 of RAMP superfamily)
MVFSMERNAILPHSITIFNAIFSILMMLYIVMNTNGR